MTSPPLSLDGWAVLALLCEGDTHRWALVRALAPEGEIGRVWSVRRALVYRTAELLIDAGLAERAGVEPGSRGSPRTLLRASAAGRRAVAAWLAEPVAHVRELRSALLLKLLFDDRGSLDARPLLAAQLTGLAPTVAALEAPAERDHGFEATLRAFRLETALAGLRFVEGELARRTRAASPGPSPNP
jgi:DNA-binding PadR family transcriptional regulator